MTGFTSNYIKIVAKYDPLLINDTLYVRLTSINEDMHVEVEQVEVEAFSH